MAVRKLTTSSIENNVWYKSMLAGNPAFNPSSFDLLETTLLSTTASSVTFSNLNNYSDYKHLQVKVVARSNGAFTWGSLRMTINGSAQTYAHRLQGNGTEVASGADASNGFPGLITGADATANNFGVTVIDILDFSNTSKNKTVRALTGVATNAVRLTSSFVNSTSAVTSFAFNSLSGGDFIAGSRFSLYGIR